MERDREDCFDTVKEKTTHPQPEAHPPPFSWFLSQTVGDDVDLTGNMGETIDGTLEKVIDSLKVRK